MKRTGTFQIHNERVPAVTFRDAIPDDCVLLARLNRELIQDERHRNRMTVAELEERTRGRPAETTLAVERLILHSKHKTPATDLPGLAIQDIGLSIPGRNRDSFPVYGRGIRNEYSGVKGTDYRKGRSGFLEGLAKRPTIFLTSEFREHYETRARANIRFICDRLSPGGAR